MSMRDRVATCFRESARSRVIAIGCFALLASCGGAPQDPVTHSTEEVELRDDGQPELRKLLAAGTWLIELRERDVDVRVGVTVPGWRAELVEAAPRHGIVYSVVSIREPAEVRVSLRSADHPSKRGHVAVRIAKFQRATTAAPGHRELGYLAWSEAGEQQALGTPESWARAADKLNEAIAHFDAADDEGARAQVAYALASLQYGERDDWTAAIRAAEIASATFDDADDELGVQNSATLRAAAELELAAGMNAGTQRAEQSALFEAADRRLAEAAAFFIEQRLPVRAAYAINMRGIRAANVGAEEDAARFFTQAVDMARANQDVAEQARYLGNLAWIRRMQGFVAQAAKEYAALLPLVDPERQTYQYGVLLNNYGFCLIALGDFDRALELHTQALDLFTRLGDEDERGTQLAALGTLYFRVGDTARALETLRAAITAQERASDTRGLASTLRLAGNAASTLGQHDLALEYLRRSAGIDANPHDVSRTRVLIAGEMRVIGNPKGAEAELAAALTSANPLVRADAFAERARMRMAQDDLPAAIADLRAADQAYAGMGLDYGRIDANAALAQLLLKSNDVAGAARAADQAVAIVQRLRTNSANPEWRARFLSARYAPFEARIAVDLAQPAAAPVDSLWRSFRTADEVRARSLTDQLALDGNAKGTRDPEEEQLRANLVAQQLRLEARVQRQDPDETGTLELRREIEETRARLDTRRLRMESVAATHTRLPESLRQVQQQLPAATVVLAYFVGETGSHAWLLGRDRLRHARLPGRAHLQQTIDAVADQRRGSPAARQAERELGRALFGNLLDDVTESRMLIIPDGPLHGVPFAALPLPRTPSELLVDRFLTGHAPSLALALASPGARKTAASRVAVIYDPVYAPDDRRLPKLRNGGNLRSEREQSPNKLTRLPYSALEARAVAETFGRNDTIEIGGFEATPGRVLELTHTDLSVLHFATHAAARSDSPERSALYLSEYRPDGTLLPHSLLTAGDIMRSGLRAQVVVLSGCATGDGSTLRGEGVLGLTYGFLANGSGSVVASLWPVEDASTAHFMNEFYRAYRITGRASEALRAAQLATRGNPAAASVWTSFVVRANGFP
jgi:CHAT domain-containing protein